MGYPSSVYDELGYGDLQKESRTKEETQPMYETSTKLVIRSFRELLWPQIPMDQCGGLDNCALIVRTKAQEFPRPSCCGTLEADMYGLKEKWNKSVFRKNLVNYLKQHAFNMRHVDRVVCFELGCLCDATGRFPALQKRSFIHHLIAYTIAETLSEAQPRTERPDQLEVKLIAEDSTYCTDCREFLSEGVCARPVELNHEGFTIVNDYASFTRENLGDHTLFMTFTEKTYALVLAMVLTEGTGGPAAIICNMVTDTGGRQPTQATVKELREQPLEDKSLELFNWTSRAVDDHHFYSINDIGEFEDLQCLTVIDKSIPGNFLVPVLHWRT